MLNYSTNQQNIIEKIAVNIVNIERINRGSILLQKTSELRPEDSDLFLDMAQAALKTMENENKSKLLNHPQAFTVSFAGKQARFILADANEHIHNQLLHSKRFYEEDLLTAIHQLAMPNAVLVDIGANIGNHAIFFASIIGGKVYAYEAQPTNFARLQANIAVNELQELIEAHQVAITAKSGVCEVIAPHAENMGQCFVAQNPNGTCQMRPLDDYDFATISFLKIDVEGAELEVIAGAAKTIEAHHPYIFIEAQTVKAFTAICAALKLYGYAPTRRFCFTPTYMFEPMPSYAAFHFENY